ncbi:MAG: TonB-dependent receptor [Bacteroidota bacterium]
MKNRTLQLLVYIFIMHALPVMALPESEKSDTIPQDREAIPPSDTLFRQLDEVVVSAFNRRQGLVEIPGAFTSVGNLVVERERPAVNILPVLEHVPGAFAQEGAINTSRVIIRGTGARVPYSTGKIRAWFNNIPLTNTTGETFLQDIDPAVIESMEIIKGPAPSIYGAGLGGTIVLNARNPQSRRTGVSNTSQAGAFGLIRSAFTLDYVRERSATSVVYSFTQSDGFRQNNEFRRNAVTLVNQLPLGRVNITSLMAFSDLRHHIPSSIDSLTYEQEPHAAAANWLRTRGYEDGRRILAGVNTAYNPLPLLRAELSLFGAWHDEKEMRPFDVFYQERYTAGSRFRAIQQQWLGIEGLELSTGGEFYYETYLHSNHQNIDGEGIQGNPISDNREDVTTWNLFSQADGFFGPFNISAGVNVNYSSRNYLDLFNTGMADQSGDFNYGWIVSPRVAAGYVYGPHNSVYLSLSHGFAPPSLDETLNPDGTINPDIRPEKSWNLEVGFRGKLYEGRFFYDLSLYSMLVEDLLVAERVGEDAWVGRNAGQSLHQGLEAELHWIILQQPERVNTFFTELSLRSAITLNRFRFTDFVDRGNDRSGKTIPGVPDQILFFSLYASANPGVYLMPSWRYSGRMAMNDANTRYSDAWSVADIVVGYKPRLSGRFSLDLFLRVNNIFDEKYASMILVNAPSFGNNLPRYYYPGLPRHIMAGLKMGL